MSFFPNSQHFQLNGGEFHAHQTNYNYCNPTGIDVLLEASTPEAAVESEEVYRRTCCPGTREQYIVDITTWVTTSHDVEPIYWMRGPAGVGKSSVATTCAKNLQSSGHLGAAFFFSVNGRRSDHTRLFPTLAYQLTTHFPEYRDILNNKVSFNKTIVKTSMPSQFRALIVEPLQELERQGLPLDRRTIFIDGLDECEKKDAQVEIVEIIAESVRTRSTPFRWAIFSREEPCIVTTFQDDSISSHCRSVLLPISRGIDNEIELYLRNEFRCILKRRNLLRLASSWPKDKDIRKLVDAAAGLFAHPAAVVRFVDFPLDWRVQERLQVVLNVILQPNGQRPTSLFAELDAFYMLVMQRVPETILPSVQLLLCYLANGVVAVSSMGNAQYWNVAVICAALGISEAEFRGICQQLHAVLCFREPVCMPVYPDSSHSSRFLLEPQFPGVHGHLSFYHKSFYEFIINPTRSSAFCVSTSAMFDKLFYRFVQQHNLFSSTYAIQDMKLALAPGVSSPSDSLSWPQGTESIDSFLKFHAFWETSKCLSLDRFSQVLGKVSPVSLQKWAALDFRKDLIAELQIWNNLGPSDVVGYRGWGRSLPPTVFECLRSEYFKPFDLTAFLAVGPFIQESIVTKISDAICQMIGKLEKAGVIRPYHLQLDPKSATSVMRTPPRPQPHGNSMALYEIGYGDRSVIWYWEIDTEKEYFHQFRTIDLAEAMKIYEKNKFVMWEESWVAPDRGTHCADDSQQRYIG